MSIKNFILYELLTFVALGQCFWADFEMLFYVVHWYTLIAIKRTNNNTTARLRKTLSSLRFYFRSVSQLFIIWSILLRYVACITIFLKFLWFICFLEIVYWGFIGWPWTKSISTDWALISFSFQIVLHVLIFCLNFVQHALKCFTRNSICSMLFRIEFKINLYFY